MEKTAKKKKSSHRKSAGGGELQDFRSSPGNSNKKSSRRPRLIQQLTPPVSTTIKGYNEDMHFNVKTCTWEGNNDDLKRFETINNNTKAPGLIAFISSNEIKVVGDMVFDPSRMCWININGNDEDDPFANIDDVDLTIKGPRGLQLQFSYGNKSNNNNNYNNNNGSTTDLFNNQQGSSQRNYTDLSMASMTTMESQRTNYQYGKGGGSSFERGNNNNENLYNMSGVKNNNNKTTGGELYVGHEFDISEDMIRKFKQVQDRWEHKVGGWFSLDADDFNDKSYLNEIRRMVMKK